ncbi:MAG TPA: CAP domain-containing protein [Burkholderiaceae bacterium]|nr:CAP domain-containing protein [Burkholderiaceae bacterium]
MLVLMHVAPASSADAYAQQLLDRVNEVRASGYVCDGRAYPPSAPLAWNGRVETAARRHADNLRQYDTFSHVGTDGSTVGKRVSESGYSWRKVGENLAVGFLEPARVVEAWLASPSHCRNVVDPAFREFGAAMEPGGFGSTYRSWWVMVVADGSTSRKTPPPSYTGWAASPHGRS